MGSGRGSLAPALGAAAAFCAPGCSSFRPASLVLTSTGACSRQRSLPSLEKGRPGGRQHPCSRGR
eukprot:11906937-Alexandrium_andersonii.AAC.1